MKKLAVIATSTFALAVVGVGFAMSGSTKSDRELRRVDCQAITMFTPALKKSAEDLCANYGGVALQDSVPSKEGLVILVRNQPVGGFVGEHAVR